LWKQDLEKLIKGQNLTNAKDKFEMTRKVLTGDALAIFQEKAFAEIVKDDAFYMKCLDALALHVFLKNALTHQKAWMHCSEFTYKLLMVKMQTWVARLNEINIMLSKLKPFFSKAQMLEEEDFFEIIEYRIQAPWKVRPEFHSGEPHFD
jgi:hypothetical protein